MSNEKTNGTGPATVQLGRDEVALIKTKSGELKLFKSTIVLNVQDKTLVAPMGMSKKINDKWVQTYLCSHDGYKLQARHSGLMTMNAPHVLVDGVQQANPHIIKDAKGQVTQIYCRALTFGYTPFGVPCISDRTAIFDLRLYKLVDLLAKAKSTPQEFKMIPSNEPGPGKGWAGYPVDEQVTLWANTATTEFTQWMAAMVNRQRKSVEIAQTFAQRNSIKHHPNISFHTTDRAQETITMLCWRPTSGDMRWDMSQYLIAAEAMEKAASPEVHDPTGPEVIKGEDALHEQRDEVEATVGAENDEVGQTIDAEVVEPQPASASEILHQTEEEKKTAAMVAQINAIIGGIPEKTVANARKASEIDDAADLSQVAMAKLVTFHRLLSAAANTGKGKK